MQKKLIISLITLLAILTSLQAQNLATPPVQLVPEILNVYDHDGEAFTQGLLLHEGLFYESTGLNGESTLRQVDPETGEVLQSIDIAEVYFAEGLERVDDKLIQLTWQSGIAFVYDLETFEQLDQFEYQGEGWGLCSNGEYLYMSDGSPFLSVRDKETFELIFKGVVTVQGQPINGNLLNELECVNGYVYGNLWQTNLIVQIDEMTGQIVGVIDASSLFETEGLERNDVLNGIAYNPENDSFFITGKLWNKMFEVRFVPAQS